MTAALLCSTQNQKLEEVVEDRGEAVVEAVVEEALAEVLLLDSVAFLQEGCQN